MNTYADKRQENKSRSVANEASHLQSGGKTTFQFVDNRPEAIAQRKLQELANNGPQARQLRAFQEMANDSPEAKQTAQLRARAASYTAGQQQPIQKKENNKGLPDNLKWGIENLSGYSMDDVKVHYNSPKPAQLEAYAYAQGTDIHLASGQEKHLPHEAWHVVQQKQGRVKPTVQMKGKVNVNDDIGLENEANVMGEKSRQFSTAVSAGCAGLSLENRNAPSTSNVAQRENSGSQSEVQVKMAEITKLLRLRFIEEDKLGNDQEEDATKVYAAEAELNGLCGGWALLFMQYPDWVEPIYNAVRTWVRPEESTDTEALTNFENHLASTTDVSKDGRGANHVVKLLRDAYNKMNELEPTAGYTHLPEWTDVNARRDMWIDPKKTSTKDRTEELRVTNTTAAETVSQRLNELTQSKKVVECMAHIESDEHHMAIRVQRRKSGVTITVVETELTGMKKVEKWSEASAIIHDWLKTEKRLKSITVKTKIVQK